jgi:hypothetical protein
MERASTNASWKGWRNRMCSAMKIIQHMNRDVFVWTPSHWQAKPYSPQSVKTCLHLFRTDLLLELEVGYQTYNYIVRIRIWHIAYNVVLNGAGIFLSPLGRAHYQIHI